MNTSLNRLSGLVAAFAITLIASPTIASDGPEKGDREIVAEAIAACRTHSMNRAKVDWDAVLKQAEEKLAEGEARHDVLEWIVGQLHDGHSSVLTAEEAKAVTGNESRAGESGGSRPASTLPPPVQPSGRLIQPEGGPAIGYVRVPYLVAMNVDAMHAYTGQLASVQASLIEQGAQGWVIDLRRNVGGNQWPMLAALSALFEEGPLGSIVSPTGQRMTWGTSYGKAWINRPDSPVYSSPSFDVPSTSDWPVAVLTDQRTASSGESVVVSFRGRPGTRSFGDRTRGASSANTSVRLSDGSMLNITTSCLFDREGQIYGGPIIPDEVFGLPTPEREASFPGEDGSPDPVLDRALQWLTENMKIN